jgi:hypothetical protein
MVINIIIGIALLTFIAAVIGFIFYKATRPGSRHWWPDPSYNNPSGGPLA